jgi:hypothetical protein
MKLTPRVMTAAIAGAITITPLLMVLPASASTADAPAPESDAVIDVRKTGGDQQEYLHVRKAGGDQQEYLHVRKAGGDQQDVMQSPWTSAGIIAIL